jgi:Uma2 family endonuclease
MRQLKKAVLHCSSAHREVPKMVAMVNDASLEKRLIAERRAIGIDRYDESWDGVYMIFAPKDNEHQGLITKFISILFAVVGFGRQNRVFAGVNISDRRKSWEHNYRCPDVAVFLNDTTAVDCGTHWQGGGDFLIEIVSPGDRSREKLDFYAKVGTRELLIVDRDPWALELYRLDDGRLPLVGTATVENAIALQSGVLPLVWKLLSGPSRPNIEIAHNDGRTWTA